MKIATWNVNGVRARQAQLLEWVARAEPDVVCLQEIKATPEQLAPELVELPNYWCCWHGYKGYSGVALLLRRTQFAAPPQFEHPGFDTEARVVTATLSDLVVASIYVPNGGKDYPAKLRFLAALDAWADEMAQSGKALVVCGDLNVTRTDQDVHPKELKPGTIGQRPDERALLEQLIGRGLVDVARHLEPDNSGLFTWWAPWRNMRQRNIGWRIDYILASAALMPRLAACTVQSDVGSSDHAPVLLTLDDAATAAVFS